METHRDVLVSCALQLIRLQRLYVGQTLDVAPQTMLEGLDILEDILLTMDDETRALLEEATGA